MIKDIKKLPKGLVRIVIDVPTKKNEQETIPKSTLSVTVTTTRTIEIKVVTMVDWGTYENQCFGRHGRLDNLQKHICHDFMHFL